MSNEEAGLRRRLAGRSYDTQEPGNLSGRGGSGPPRRWGGADRARPVYADADQPGVVPLPRRTGAAGSGVASARQPTRFPSSAAAQALAVALVVCRLAFPGGALAQSATTSTPLQPRVLMDIPGGDTIAHLAQGAAAEVVERDGEWVRIRVEGWIRADTTFAAQLPPGGLRLTDLRAEPDRYIGELVRWRVQHIALQRADSLRSDMERGQPYLLLRDPGGESGFVYAIVPSPLMSAAGALAPLQRVQIVARVREGRSPLTGHPIVELVELIP